MKVRLIRRTSIIEFATQYAGSRAAFRIWLSLLKQADWTSPGDIVQTFGSADLLGNGTRRVVFDIGGNHYRMICGYHFGITKVHLYVKWIGTHTDYTRLCNKNGQYTVTLY